ncbi:MAG: glucan 1,4-alpha-glucosidase [Geodermatophilaceae bacterium]|nr:glucan 1,4-alpha-glucosidase [Geodermatophilaceae bacterium]
MSRRLTVLLSGLLLAGGLAVPASAAPSPAVAAGAPGSLSHYDLARKDCLGTARNTTSKVWYTVADGVLSDVYSPYIDQTNVETVQYVVTDGATFTDLQTRDMSYTVQADRTGMSCTVTSTADSGRYRLVTTYLTDPDRDSVVWRTTLVPRAGEPALKLYVRYDATIGGHGGGGDPASQNGGADTATVDAATTALVSGDPVTVTDATNRDYARPLAGALRADKPFVQARSGYAGSASDGLVQLDADRRLTTTATTATPGNVVQTALLDTGSGTGTATVELALGYGRDAATAVSTAGSSVGASFTSLLNRYLGQWRAYDATLDLPTAAGLAGVGTPAEAARAAEVAQLSANVLKASEDKTYAGAIVASLASPWGQAVSAGDRPGGAAGRYFGSYREIFGRDLYEAATGLLAVGDVATPQASARFLLERQQLADGRLPRNSLLNGQLAQDSGGDQLDQTSYALLLAWQSGLASDVGLYDDVRAAADFVVSRGPSFGVERWEEQSGYSPSTIAAQIAGLVAAASIADVQGDRASARTWRATADEFTRRVKGWTVTTTGPYSAGPYFIRLSKTGDPDAGVVYNLGNGGPDADERTVLDGGFLELTRLGILPVDDPDVVATLPLVDAVIGRTTPSGDSWYRYGTDGEGSEDGYGDDAETGRPWPTTGTGTGHLWPVLSGERAEHSLAAGDTARAGDLLVAMSDYSSGVGLVPEQSWEDPALPASPYGTPPEQASIGFVPGGPAGSAAPLSWAQAQQLRLAVTLARGGTTPVEQPAVVANRYRQGPIPEGVLTVTEPVDGALVETPSVQVSGTGTAGSYVDVSATPVDTGGATTRFGARVPAGGTWTVSVPVAFGSTVLTVTSSGLGRATAYERRTVVSDVIDGTTVLDVTDPAGDDNGPGTFAYPTSADFKDGAFDLTGFQVINGDDGTTYLRAAVRDLSPTFGDPLGAQLLTVFVHDPAATETSTQPFYDSRNYTVDPQDAWSRALQVRGFASPRLIKPDFSSAGSVGVQASQASGYITMTIPPGALGGTPDAGWSFAIALWGQDGFGIDEARPITATPQDFTFGVCAEGSTDPRCVLDPADAPFVMDTITPPGVEQSILLDALLGPVQLRGVAIS